MIKWLNDKMMIYLCIIKSIFNCTNRLKHYHLMKDEWLMMNDVGICNLMDYCNIP